MGLMWGLWKPLWLSKALGSLYLHTRFNNIYLHYRCVRVHVHCMELGLESFILMVKGLFSVSPDASASWNNEWDLTIPQQELLELPG